VIQPSNDATLAQLHSLDACKHKSMSTLDIASSSFTLFIWVLDSALFPLLLTSKLIILTNLKPISVRFGIVSLLFNLAAERRTLTLTTQELNKTTL